MELSALISTLKNEYKGKGEEFFSFTDLIGELLLSLEIDPKNIFINPSLQLEPKTVKELIRRFNRALSGEPLQYVTGKAYFCNEEYFVGEGVLIPRDDSTVLVEKARDYLPKDGRFLDLCTGSGCLAVSLLSMRRDVCGTGVDISDKALSYAKKNALHNGVSERLTLIMGDIRQKKSLPKVNMIISNPPYISKKEMEDLPVNVRHEPTLALFGGEDGLDFYRVIIENYKELILPSGYFIFEIGEKQGEEVSLMLEKAGFRTEIFSDYSSRPRVVTGKKYEK